MKKDSLLNLVASDMAENFFEWSENKKDMKSKKECCELGSCCTHKVAEYIDPNMIRDEKSKKEEILEEWMKLPYSKKLNVVAVQREALTVWLSQKLEEYALACGLEKKEWTIDGEPTKEYITYMQGWNEYRDEMIKKIKE